eukprot:13456340-Heterocapsa_arctica.AAC.1
MMLGTAEPPATPGAGPALAQRRRRHRGKSRVQGKRLGYSSPSQVQRPGVPQRRVMRNPSGPSKGKTRNRGT